MTEPSSDPNHALRRAVEVAPTRPEDALAILGDALTRADATIDPAAAANLACHAAVISARLGHFERARDYYRQAASIAPDNATVHLALGGLLRDLGELEGAESEFAKSADLAYQGNDSELFEAADAAREALRGREP